MLLFWRIRYLDSRDKQFKDRDLYLETDSLDAITRASVEALCDMKDTVDWRTWLRFRHLFKENLTNEELKKMCERHTNCDSPRVSPYYCEDENGKELNYEQSGTILMGKPAILFPSGTRPYHIAFTLADKSPIEIDRITITDANLVVLGYFVRDLKEMQGSSFFKNKPGTLTSRNGRAPVLETATTDEEIRSFVTIFRRLYMKGERGNFLRAVAVFVEAIQGHPLANWVQGIADDYKKEINEKPNFAPFGERDNWRFSRKRIIEVFIYTQYAHQPDEKRQRQYRECLAAVDNRKSVLTWIFLSEIWCCGKTIGNVGRIIANFYEKYCQYHNVSPDILMPITSDNPGLGTQEKRQERRDRIFNEKTEELAHALWLAAGQPPGGPEKFLAQAREQIEKQLR